jgi:hypothetical protein
MAITRRDLLHGLAAAPLAIAPASSEMPPRERIAGRTFPSVFQAWSPADNLRGEDALITAARHDLLFHGPEFFGLRWKSGPVGLATDFEPESTRAARERRAALLAKNPHMVLLAEVRYRDAHRSWLPADHPWWKRDASGKIEPGWEEGGYLLLDFANPAYQRQVARQCAACVRSGAVDGVMLDWWMDDDNRLRLIRAVREAVGGDTLIVANANDRQTPRTASHINGYFMECYRSETPDDWNRIEDTLVWAEKNLREPRINCVETWYHASRQDLNLMRAVTTMALTLSDGYCLFSDPNPLPTPDHRHDWYPFWEKRLGKPTSRPGILNASGAYIREFTNGTAVFHPLRKHVNPPASVSFDSPRRSVATGNIARQFTVPRCDGDIFLRGYLPKGLSAVAGAGVQSIRG